MTKHRLPWEPLPEPDPATLAGRIVLFRRQNSLSQRKLAETLGVSPQNISLWETGKHRPDGARLRELARVLGTSVQELERATSVIEAAETVDKLQHEIDALASKFSHPIRQCDAYVTARDDLCIMRVTNTDAMQPCCQPKDLLVVDTGAKEPGAKPYWYVLSDRMIILIRQVEAINNNYRLTSCNAEIVPREVLPSDVTILGRVVGKVQMFF